MSPKLKVKPRPLQACVLVALAENENMAVTDYGRNCWRSLVGDYRDEILTKKKYGILRGSTVKSCLKEGWLEPAQGRWNTFVISTIGKEIAATLSPDDLLITPKEGYTTRVVIEALRTKHPYPTWLFGVEVRLATGWGGAYYKNGQEEVVPIDQRIDVWTMHTWPSKKFVKIAYEIKIGRGDFLNELKHPKKRLAAEHFSNLAYFAAPEGLIKPEELPDQWGLIEINGDLTTTKTEAIWRNDVGHALPDRFVASLGRTLMAT